MKNWVQWVGLALAVIVAGLLTWSIIDQIRHPGQKEIPLSELEPKK